MDLRIKGTDPGANMGIRVLDVVYAGAQPSDIEKAIIKDLFRQWFEANLDTFTTVFASVNLNAKADVGQFQWLMPTHVSYAVAEESSLPDGIFAVLCMTEDRDPTGLGHQVSPYAIPAGQRSAFLISPERYLTKMLLPGIGMMFAKPSGASDSDWPDKYFDRLPDGSITNNKMISIAQLEIEEGQTREAFIPARQFSVRISDKLLEINFVNMHHDYQHALSWLKVNHTIVSTATAKLLDGQKFSLEPGEGTHSIFVTKDPTAEWIEIGIIATTLLFMGAGMIKGAARTWRAGVPVAEGNVLAADGTYIVNGPLTRAEATRDALRGATGCMAVFRRGALKVSDALSAFWQNYRATWMAGVSTATGGTAAIMKIIELIADKDSQDMLPNFNEFSAGVMAPIQWPDAQSEFEVQDIAFNRSFQVSGDPGFAD